MIRIQLSQPELSDLEQVLRTTSDPKLRTRVQIVLMAHRDRPHGQIACDTGTSRSAVQRWLNAYLGRGLDALRPRKPGKPHPRLTADLAPVLRGWVIAGPQAQGLDRANWTHAELAEHLFRTHGVRVGKSAMQAFCRRQEIRPYRPTYRFLRGDPAKQAEAREALAGLKRGPRRVNLCS
jgi:transposase